MFEHYKKYGMMWSDGDVVQLVGHLPEFWGVSLNGGKAAPTGAARWHPGPRNHALRGHAMALGFLGVFEEALRSVEEMLSANGDPAELIALATATASEPLPPPISGSAASHMDPPRPRCATTVAPGVGKRLSDYAVSPIRDGLTSHSKRFEFDPTAVGHWQVSWFEGAVRSWLAQPSIHSAPSIPSQPHAAPIHITHSW